MTVQALDGFTLSLPGNRIVQEMDVRTDFVFALPRFKSLFLQRFSVDDDPFRKVQPGKGVFRECRI
ncbi:hypothetical protein Pan153_38700 [Gimesia panareensis]|uniref:Uncharacterized protein n=1 Tax=Gimesia panareensis TaxID=2527978 RepID=A0A518FSC9_9PLAN|nr:hypothetical protein Pan153_38700 [Gimesia panareensis]